jgi:hypothetical protein
MESAPLHGFQQLWSNQIESLCLGYVETMKEHPNADAVMKRVHGVLVDISRLAGCTPGISRWKSSMDCNHQKRDGDEEETPSPAEGKAAVQRPLRGIHRGVT